MLVLVDGDSLTVIILSVNNKVGLKALMRPSVHYEKELNKH